MEKQLFKVGSSVPANILKSFNRNEKSVNEDVETVKEWMKKQPHLPEIMDDKMILNFLTLNKCSVEKCKQKIDMYYTVRSVLSDIFKNSNPKLTIQKEVRQAVYVVPLPELTQDMYRVFIVKTRDQKIIEDMDLYSLLCHVTNLQEIRMREDVYLGDIFIIDCDNISLKCLRKVTPVLIYNIFVRVYQNVFSSRMKAVYVINAPPIVDTLLTIVKTVLKPKMVERIHLFKNPEVIKQIFPLEILPKDYGGEEKSLDELQELVEWKFDEYQERFDRLDELRVDEKLRPKRLENDGFLELHGNFKQLELD